MSDFELSGLCMELQITMEKYGFLTPSQAARLIQNPEDIYLGCIVTNFNKVAYGKAIILAGSSGHIYSNVGIYVDDASDFLPNAKREPTTYVVSNTLGTTFLHPDKNVLETIRNKVTELTTLMYDRIDQGETIGSRQAFVDIWEPICSLIKKLNRKEKSND